MTTELREKEKNRATLKEMVNRKENAACADCGRRRPRWASINLGVFICDTCAGVHRGIGVHITQVRSIDLDDWKNEWVKVMEKMGGNIKANEIYEAKNRNPVKTEVTNEAYIREKYVDKKWWGKPKASKKKEETTSDASSESEEEVKPKKKAVAKKVEVSESEEEKPKTKKPPKKVESEDSDSEAEDRHKAAKAKSKKEEAPKKAQSTGFELPLSAVDKPKAKAAPAATTSKKTETAWDPFGGGTPQVQEQNPADEWSVFTATPAKPVQPAAAPVAAQSGWNAFGTDDATAGIAGLSVGGPQIQPQVAPAQPARPAGPSKGDILNLFDHAPAAPQMGMGMPGMGMAGPAMGMGAPMMPGMGGMGMGGMMMPPLMTPQQQQQYMMQQRMNPMQQQQFMMQQQQLMMMMMQQQQRAANPLFPTGQPQMRPPASQPFPFI